MGKMTRRRFLGASVAAVGAAAFPNFPSALRTALATTPAGNSLFSVQHVVILMQENRSFDHYFGALQGVRGFGDRTALTLRNGNSVFKQPNSNGSSKFTLPFHLDTSSTSAQCVRDLDHTWGGTHSAWDSARFDNWVPAKSATTMGYYTRNDIPFHYALADGFTLCDSYFCSVMGPTNPNRLYLWSGSIDPNGTAGGPVTDNSETGYRWTTYPERLQAAGVSWKVYQNGSDNYDDNALAWFAQYHNAQPGSPLYDRGMASVPKVTGNTVGDIVAALESDVRNGTLPQVSWIVGPADHSEHPTHDPANGADFISRILGALTSDPSVWASTVFLINYDENDGFFDHLPPPVPPAGTPDEFVGGLPIGLGPRVPLFVISPWSRGGHVCSEVFDHTSIIRFLEVWTGVAEPNISAWRRSVCGDLISAFDFSSSTMSLPALPDTAALAAQAAQQCTSLPAPKPPNKQALPTQEPGTRPARPLPYQPNAVSSVDHAAGRLLITLSNTGAQAVHHAIYANNYRSDGPWQYDVPANTGSVSDYFSVQTYGGGKYDLSIYGPNGFLRQLVGDINAAGGQLEVTAAYDLSVSGQAKLVLTMTNNSNQAAVFTIKANAYRGDGPWTFTVAPGQSISNAWEVQAAANCWYDFSASVDVDALFARRFAGHIEVGSASVTG
jgi:phospholipase C